MHHQEEGDFLYILFIRGVFKLGKKGACMDGAYTSLT